MNKIICGDNVKALDELTKEGIRVDLIYLDPPFFSNRNYEVIWKDEAEVRSFNDRWEGGMNVYIEWMRERISKMYDILKDTGSIYLHCDWHASHYLKVMMDEVFGMKNFGNFRNEIVWCYSGGGQSKTSFPKKHDTIFFYTKSKQWTFNYNDPSLKTQYCRELSDKEVAVRGDKTYGWKGNPLGKMVEDWWQIPILNPVSRERLGYPTQKPEALLERIIKASSNEGDIVLDAFCGCGTALAVAQRLKRKWIGIDISPTAVKIITERLEKLGATKKKDFEVIGMPTTLTELRELKPFEFQNWVINEMKAKQSKKLSGDFGLDGYYDEEIHTERAGIQVKQSESIGRNVIDNFETALKRGKFKKGFIIAFTFTKGAHEEAARIKGELKIRLIEVEDLLLGKVKTYRDGRS